MVPFFHPVWSVYGEPVQRRLGRIRHTWRTSKLSNKNGTDRNRVWAGANGVRYHGDLSPSPRDRGGHGKVGRFNFQPIKKGFQVAQFAQLVRIREGGNV